MSAPQVTVVVPTYNRAALLERALGSVRRQTYPHVVIAVYDNASSDATEAIVRDAALQDPRIRYHRHASNVGAANNYLYGLREITTPLFSLLSDDDVMLPDFLNDAVAWLERFPAAKFAAGGTLEMTDRGELLFAPQAHWPREGYFEPPDGLDLLLGGFHPSWTTMVFRREVLDEVGEFNPAILNVSDLDFTLRIACRYPYVVFRKPSGIFLRHQSSGGEFADASVLGQYEVMAAGLTAIEGTSDATKTLIAAKVAQQQYKRMLQVAVKQLLRDEAQASIDTMRAYHARRGRTPLSACVAAAAFGVKSFRPLGGVFRGLDALRRRVRTRMSLSAARDNGAGTIDPNLCSAALALRE